MKLLITYTLLCQQKITTVEQLAEITQNMVEFLPQYYNRKDKKGLKDFHYDIISLSWGIHQDATRLHSHIGHYIETNNDKKVLHWDKSLRPIIHPFIEKFKTLIDFKISFSKTEINDLDIKNVVGYPLKEYSKNSEIIKPESFTGLSSEKIEDLRNYANLIWQTTKREKQIIANKKVIEEDTIEQKYIWVDKEVAKINTLDWHRTPADIKIRMVITWLLQYQKAQYDAHEKRSFKVACIKDLAVNYLYNKSYITESDIIQIIIKL